MPFPGLNAHRLFTGVRWEAGERADRAEEIAEETPIALLYNGAPHVVMMGSPQDLEDFALGFSISEGLIESPSDIESVEVLTHPEGLALSIQCRSEGLRELSERRRNLTGRTGCGLCGAETLAQAMRAPKPVDASPVIPTESFQQALDEMSHVQPINALTGAVHAAMWCDLAGHIETVREDVGRHNALDKLIGARLGAGQSFEAGFLLMTSRASYELIYKASQVGVGTLAALSAPTGLAIRMADEAGMTLVGFLRHGRHTVYTGPRRHSS
jgi:FdhD protein